MEAEWTAEGCLPPDDADMRIRQLESDVDQRLIPESERGRIAANADFALVQGIINEKIYKRILEAVKVDEKGDLLRPEGDPIVENTNLSDV